MKKRIYEIKKLMEIIDLKINDQESYYYYFNITFNFKNNVAHIYFHDNKFYCVHDIDFRCSEKLDSYFFTEWLFEYFEGLGYFCEIKLGCFEVDFEEKLIDISVRFKEVTKNEIN